MKSGDVIKMGRTQLQDAVPMTLGQEFHGYATNIGEEVLRLENAADLLLEVNLGATAIGTGLNTPDGYPGVASRKLSEVSGYTITEKHVAFDEELPENVFSAKMDGGIVCVDVTLDDDLIAEGYSREVIRIIQEMRKQLDLQVDDSINAVVQYNFIGAG